MNFEALIRSALPHALDLRRRLHQIPELYFQEYQTAALIREELSRLGLKFTAGVQGADTATVAVIGDTSKPCIALRADIDALPILEQTGAAYASTHPGKMHACGHDGHTAILLCAAAVLKQAAHDLPVCVKLIWQPAEEQGGGAQRLVNAGVLDGRVGPKVDAIFGLHGWPTLPVSTISTSAGPIMASTDSFSITFTGRGCHGAFPHLGVDPIVAASEAVLNLQQCVSRELDPTEPGVVTIGTVNAGSAVNIIPDEARLTGTLRSVTPAARTRLREAVERRCRGIAAAQGCQFSLHWEEGYPATVNDPAMAARVAEVARANLGEKQFTPAPHPSMGGEDFAFYLEQVPGCFFFLGVRPEGSSSYPSLHNSRYDFVDAALPTGVRMFCELAARPLNCG